MGSNISDNVRGHAYLEEFKAESLDTCIKMFEYMGRTLPDEGKEHVLKLLDDMAVKFDIIKNYDIDAYKFKIDDDGEEVPFAKVSDVEEVFYDFRERLTALILQLVLFDLELFLAKEGLNDE